MQLSANGRTLEYDIDAFNHEVLRFLNWVVKETPGEAGVPGLPTYGAEPS